MVQIFMDQMLTEHINAFDSALYKCPTMSMICKGYSMDMDHVIKKASGTSQWNIDVSVNFMHVSVAYLQVLIIFELVAYLTLFWHMKHYNENLESYGNLLNISEKAIYQRKRKNVITFVGQFACFIVEIVVSVIVQILTVYHGSNAGNGLVPVLFISSSAILSAAFIVASPEIRRFYFN